MTRWEMGSEFHLLTEFAENGSSHEPFHGELFANGRAALRSIVERIQPRRTTCWIPSYVCEAVHDVLAPVANLRVYKDYPDEPETRFESLSPEPNDIVLVQDTFGLGSIEPWRAWKRQNSEILVIEDISHSSTQERFLQSPADYVFSSLRKSLPVADGGLIFSPEGGLCFAAEPACAGAHLKLEAMILKSMYLQGYPVEKHVFRELQVAGEEQIDRVNLGAALTLTGQLLHSLPHESLRSQWRANNQQLQTHLQETSFLNVLRVLKPRESNFGLFHTVVKCVDASTRDALRSHLIDNSIFPAVHWPQPHNAFDSHALCLSDVMLTLPTDFRYNCSDIDRLAAILEDGLRQL